MTEDQVILVDENDRELGAMDKMQAHVEGKLHRALSVFIFNSRGDWLLQKRAEGKYHSAGLWTNTCCSHPRPGEPTELAAHRRLSEEMGIGCRMKLLFTFQYKADVGNSLIEHELDHVFAGMSDLVPVLNPAEAQEWRYCTADEIAADLLAHPENYTQWFRIVFERVRGGLTFP